MKITKRTQGFIDKQVLIAGQPKNEPKKLGRGKVFGERKNAPYAFR
jgi:hypothetical protein